MRIDPKPTQPAPQSPRDAALHKAAEAMEAQFLAEMLKPMGADKEPGSFGGGEGEAQFRSLLVDEQARAMVRAGGVGLAEALFRALSTREGGGDGQ